MTQFMSSLVSRWRERDSRPVAAGRVCCPRTGTDVDIESCLVCSEFGGSTHGDARTVGLESVESVQCRFRPDRYESDVLLGFLRLGSATALDQGGRGRGSD